jgi:hypothetical protein
VFQPIEKKDRKAGLDDYKKYEEMLNKKTKRKGGKTAKKDTATKAEKEESKKVEEQKVEPPKEGENAQ